MWGFLIDSINVQARSEEDRFQDIDETIDLGSIFSTALVRSVRGSV